MRGPAIYFNQSKCAGPCARESACLGRGGASAFSEPCLLPRPSQGGARFLVGWEYPQITELMGGDSDRGRRGASGDTRGCLGENLQNWRGHGKTFNYLPMRNAGIASLRPGASPELAAALDTAEAEIARWRAAPSEIAYALMVVAPE